MVVDSWCETRSERTKKTTIIKARSLGARRLRCSIGSSIDEINELREPDDGEFAARPGREVDSFTGRSDYFFLYPRDERLVMMHEDDDVLLPELDGSLIGEEDDIFGFAMGEEEYRLGGNWEIVIHHLAAAIGDHVLDLLRRERHEILRHIAIILVERSHLGWTVREIDEVLGEVDKSAAEESDKEEREERKPEAEHRASGIFYQPHDGYRRHEEDRRLGADSPQGMREPLLREEFRHEHHKERDEEESRTGYGRIAHAFSEPPAEPLHQVIPEVTEASEEEDAGEWIEDRVRRVVVPPVLIAPEVVLDEREAECLGKGPPEVAPIHFRREDRDGPGARGQVLGVGGKLIDEGCGSYRSAEDEGQTMLPEALEEVFVGEDEEGEKRDEDEGRQAIGDVGVDADAEDETGKQEGADALGTEALPEEVKSEGEEAGHHDGPEADPGEIDGPEGCGQEKGGNETRSTALEEFFPEEVDAEDGEGPKDSRPELEHRDRVAEVLDRERLEVDEEAFAAVVVGVEELILSGLDGSEGIDAVDGFIRVEAARDAVDVVDAHEECDRNNSEEEHDAEQSAE